MQRALAGDVEGQPPADQFARGLELFQQYYASGICIRSEPCPHVLRTLTALRASRILTGCVTNKPERLAHLLLDALALAPLFDVIVGGDTLAFEKPHPGPIQYACRQLNLGPADVVYVGDSMTDCRAANAAGVLMVGVAYGYHQGADLTKASCAAIIDSLNKLPAILKTV